MTFIIFLRKNSYLVIYIIYILISSIEYAFCTSNFYEFYPPKFVNYALNTLQFSSPQIFFFYSLSYFHCRCERKPSFQFFTSSRSEAGFEESDLCSSDPDPFDRSAAFGRAEEEEEPLGLRRCGCLGTAWR